MTTPPARGVDARAVDTLNQMCVDMQDLIVALLVDHLDHPLLKTVREAYLVTDHARATADAHWAVQPERRSHVGAADV